MLLEGYLLAELSLKANLFIARNIHLLLYLRCFIGFTRSATLSLGTSDEVQALNREQTYKNDSNNFYRTSRNEGAAVHICLHQLIIQYCWE